MTIERMKGSLRSEAERIKRKSFSTFAALRYTLYTQIKDLDKRVSLPLIYG